MGLLGTTLVTDIAHNDGYQQNQILRQAFEVAANFVYLSEDDGSSERFDAFVNAQLAEEKNNLDVIARLIRQPGDDPLPIEERMRSSMERMASAAEIDLDDVPRLRDSGWPNGFERFKALGPAAYLPYRTGSSSLHGGWSTLLIQELDDGDGGFTLSGRGSPPDARAFLALPATILLVTGIHLDELCGEAERTIFRGRLDDIGERRQRLDKLHEDWFQS